MKPTFLVLLAALAACQSPGTAGAEPAPSEPSLPVAAPLALEGKAYDSAGQVALPEQSPQELAGLHNVFHLSEDIVSGSEPHGPEALQVLRDMGIKTIISVDGKAPEAEAAAALGMRYVHVPIQYSGIGDDDLARLSKTYRELEGPFYVHCFHGKHRGPAAAAVGRVVLDGASRETAIAEMRQYCGTSAKYEGLYRVIATGPIPGAAATRTYAYAFPAIDLPEGVVGSMVEISRAHDHIADLSKRGWTVDPEHPDVDPQNEVAKLLQGFEAACQLGEVVKGPTDQADWFVSSREDTRKLQAELASFLGGDAAAGAAASATFKKVQATCDACHAAYRN